MGVIYLGRKPQQYITYFDYYIYIIIYIYYIYIIFFFTRGRYDPSGGIIVIITIIMSGRSGLVLCGQKCALKSNMIETLNADGKPLEEKRGFTFITSGERSAITNLANEIQ